MDKLLEAKLKKMLETGQPEDLKLVQSYLDSDYIKFIPRPNDPDMGDEMESYINDKWRGVKCVLGGNASAKTYASSWAVANFLYQTPAPRSLTPFIIASQNFQMVGAIWQQKLSRFLPESMIKEIRWRNVGLEFPSSVILKPDEKGNNWVLQFYSYEQGREAFQAVDAGGFFLDEQCPAEVFTEILTRCRTYYFPNSMFYSLTPLEPDEFLEDLYKRRHDIDVAKLWKFYRLNTEKNNFLSKEWFDAYYSNMPSEIRATRMLGEFLHFEGLIYKEFSEIKHSIDPFPIPDDAKLYIGIDFGYRNAAVIWVFNWKNNWYIYDELLLHEELTEDMAQKIKDKHFNHLHSVWCDWEDPAAMTRLKEQGIYPKPAVKEVNAGIESVRMNIIGQNGIPQLFVFNSCKETIKEFKRYTWQKAPKKQLNPTDAADKPVKKDDHLLDALRYIIHSEMKNKLQPWEGVPNKVKSNRFMDAMVGRR